MANKIPSTYYYIGALLLVLIIFFFIPTKSYFNSKSALSISSGDESIESYQKKWVSGLKPESTKKFEQIQSEMESASDSISRLQAMSHMIDFLNQEQAPELASFYVYKKAELIQNANSWEITGDNFVQTLNQPHVDTSLIQPMISHAIKSYEHSTELDSNLVSAKLKLAQAYMEGQNEPMKGVKILLDVVKKDRNQIEAQLLLAKFGLISGQYEKVAQRLENVLSLQPQNFDALLMRAEVYANTQQKDKAIQDLKKVQALPNIPAEMKNQLEVAIKRLQQK